MIKGTEYENILILPPKTPQKIKQELEFDRYASQIQEVLPKYEHFFNKVFPHITL